jgi:hypothetical protein
MFVIYIYVRVRFWYKYVGWEINEQPVDQSLVLYTYVIENGMIML